MDITVTNTQIAPHYRLRQSTGLWLKWPVDVIKDHQKPCGLILDIGLTVHVRLGQSRTVS